MHLLKLNNFKTKRKPLRWNFYRQSDSFLNGEVSADIDNILFNFIIYKNLTSPTFRLRVQICLVQGENHDEKVPKSNLEGI